MRRVLIAGNWKMNKTAFEGRALAEEVRNALEAEPSAVDVLMAPPFTALHVVGATLQGSQIALGGQNMHFEPSGAFTGEISAPMLKDAGCSHVILGHSERRHIFEEGDALIARKVQAAVARGLCPIVCVGETLEERQAGKTTRVVLGQVDASLGGLPAGVVGGLVVAYEPVWAIGTGHAATPAQAQEVHALIRGRVAEVHGPDPAGTVRILYGGSVKPENITAIMAERDVDGALVGGACLEAASFLRIIHGARRK
jgi:triosephosphate isomerase